MIKIVLNLKSSDTAVTINYQLRQCASNKDLIIEVMVQTLVYAFKFTIDKVHCNT